MNRSDFKEQIVKIIPKVENTSEHENQIDTINDRARAMESEQLNNTINDTARVMQSKQYDQRYGQNNAIKAIYPAIQSGQTRGW